MKTLTSQDPEFLEFTGRQESQFLMQKNTWRESLLNIVNGDVISLGDFLPWSKTNSIVRLRPGEVSIWAGINGHGKSMVTGQVALWLMRHCRVCIASLEMKPERTLHRMMRQASGVEEPSPAYADRFLDYKPDNLWIYDQLDTVDSNRILGMIHYAARKLDIKHVFIDSLMKCGVATDDYNAQKEFVDRLCWIAKSEDIHVHLIHHMRKGGKETDRPGKFDVRGASEIVDLVDNLFIVFRNKTKEDKERKKAAGKPVEIDDGEPDALLTVAKQRHGEWEGPIMLWFHKASQQYIPAPRDKPMPWPSPNEQWSFP